MMHAPKVARLGRVRQSIYGVLFGSVEPRARTGGGAPLVGRAAPRTALVLCMVVCLGLFCAEAVRRSVRLESCTTSMAVCVLRAVTLCCCTTTAPLSGKDRWPEPSPPTQSTRVVGEYRGRRIG